MSKKSDLLYAALISYQDQKVVRKEIRFQNNHASFDKDGKLQLNKKTGVIFVEHYIFQS